MGGGQVKYLGEIGKKSGSLTDSCFLGEWTGRNMWGRRPVCRTREG